MSRFRWGVYLVALGWTVLSLCSQGLAQTVRGSEGDRGGQQESQFGGMYRTPLLNNPSTLDPAYVQDMYGLAVVQQLFDGLVRFSPDLFVIPALAENWRVEDGGKTYRFFLRKNARFHNDRPVTSQDVIFSLSRLLRIDPPSTILPHLLRIVGARSYQEHGADKVSGMEAVDDHTLVIHLDQPYAPFLVALGMYQAKIVPEEEVEKKGKAFGLEPVGSGPFQFVSWQTNHTIRLKRFAQYYGGPSFLDGIEFLIYPGIQIDEVWADFEKGRLDEMPVYGQILGKLKDRKDLQWFHRPSLSLQFYGFNCRNPRLKNPELRGALRAVIDQRKLVAEVYKGQVEAAGTILPPGMPGYQPELTETGKATDAMVEHFKQTLGEEIKTLGPVEIVSNSQSPIAQAELKFVGDAWARLGVTLAPKFIPDWSQFEHYIQSESMQLYRYVWFADIPDPDAFLRNLFASDSRVNFMRYRDDTVDRMLQTALGILDPMERAGMYRKVEEEIAKSSPIVPLLYMSIDFVCKPAVQGIQVSALGAQKMSYHQVWLRRSSTP